MIQPPLRSLPIAGLLAAALLGGASLPAHASSHREAPFIAGTPKLDGTDFYMFRSYESGRSGFVTMIANYLPLQDAYGGPNYFSLDPDALYEIHLDNNGDAKEDITFQFRFKNTLKDIALPISGKNVSIPLIQAGGLSGVNPAILNVRETFTVDIVRGDRRTGQRQRVTSVGGGAEFDKPVDNIGDKTFGGPTGYAQYAGQHVHRVTQLIGTSTISEVTFLSASLSPSPLVGPNGFRLIRSKTLPSGTAKGSLRWPTKILPSPQPGMLTRWTCCAAYCA